MTLGRAISEARKKLNLSQKELAGAIKKEDGAAISPQYLNDIEHDRRTPSSFVMEQFAKVLRIERDKDWLYFLTGSVAPDLTDGEADREAVVKFYKAFRKNLKG